MEATAKHDFQATAEDELSFKKGSILKVKLVVRSGLPYGNVAILPRVVYIYISIVLLNDMFFILGVGNRR